MIATDPTVVADMPAFDHGEIADNSKPAPSASMINDTAVAINAPPIAAPQDIPDDEIAGPATENSELAMNPPTEWVNPQHVLFSRRETLEEVLADRVLGHR